MNRIRYYGPTLVLALTVLAVLLGGPSVMRQLAYAEAQAKIAAADEQLESARLVDLSRAFRAIAERTKHSVVHISVERRPRTAGNEGRQRDLEDFFRRRFGMPIPPRGEGEEPAPERDEGMHDFDAPQPYGSGSGWVYDADGHIVTNFHVIKDADVIRVRFNDDSSLKAKLVGADPKTDIAVLKVEANRGLHPAPINVEPVEQGDIVFAFGSPFEFEFSMSQGIVSGKGRQLGILDQRDRYGRRIASGYENFIQTDAAINRGNSGGPLVDARGKLVGMNTAIASPNGGNTGIGFAIPAAMIQRYVPQLIEDGQVSRGYLGVAITDDPKLLRSFGVEHGVVIDNLLPDGPAGKAGLEVEDVVVEIDGKKVRDANHLRTLIADYGPDAKVKVTVVRQGKRVHKTVTLVEQPETMSLGSIDRGDGDDVTVDEDDLMPLKKLGLEELAAMTKEMAKRLGVEFEQGVVIENVRRGSVADAEGLRPGMLITRVQSEPIEDLEDLAKAFEDVDLAEGVRLRIAGVAGDRWVGRSVVLQLPE